MFDKIKPNSPIVICDIGASPVDPMLFIEILTTNINCILYGFEPNENEFKKYKGKFSTPFFILNYITSHG